MLFKFGTFWKTTCLIIGSWLLYGLWDFEFVTITLLAAILATNLKSSTKLL